jgi:hypothetical protein
MQAKECRGALHNLVGHFDYHICMRSIMPMVGAMQDVWDFDPHARYLEGVTRLILNCLPFHLLPHILPRNVFNVTETKGFFFSPTSH